MYIPESNKIPAEYEISTDLCTVLQFYKAPESMLADILRTDENTVRKTETQKNTQISDDMLFRLGWFSVKQLSKLEDKAKKGAGLTEKEILLAKCVTRLKSAVDKELSRRMTEGL